MSTEPEIHSQDAGKWAGEPTPLEPDSAIATAVERNGSAKSPAEKCMDQEFEKLMRKEGSKTYDPDGLVKRTKESIGMELIRDGYCDESVFGKEHCQDFKNSMASTVDIVVSEKRRMAQENALETLQKGGPCNPNVLGVEFCKNELRQWDITPVGVKPIRVTPQLPGQKPMPVSPH